MAILNQSSSFLPEGYKPPVKTPEWLEREKSVGQKQPTGPTTREEYLKLNPLPEKPQLSPDLGYNPRPQPEFPSDPKRPGYPIQPTLSDPIGRRTEPWDGMGYDAYMRMKERLSSPMPTQPRQPIPPQQTFPEWRSSQGDKRFPSVMVKGPDGTMIDYAYNEYLKSVGTGGNEYEDALSNLESLIREFINLKNK